MEINNNNYSSFKGITLTFKKSLLAKEAFACGA
jgi:hypothetical protein